MKRLLVILLLLCGLCAAPANAACAGGTCFGIATGNWGTAGTWAITSGGVSCVCTPATGDAIVLDAASGANTFTMEAAYSIASLVTTGFTGTLTQNAFTMTVSGNTFTLVAGMTYTPSASNRAVTFTSTSGTTAITTAGKTLGNVTFNGVAGTFQLQDALNVRSDSTVTHTSGTFDTNTKTATIGSFTSNSGTTRVLTITSSTITLNSSTAAWTMIDTGLTLTATSSTIAFDPGGATNSGRSFNGGSKTFGTVTVAANTGSGSITFSTTNAGTVTIPTVTISAPNYVTWGTGLTSTFAITTLNMAGSSGSEIGILASGTVNISIASGTPTFTWIASRAMTYNGGATFAATSSFDLGGNTGITITPPASGGSSGGKIIGGWLLRCEGDNDNVPCFLNKAA